MDWDNLAYRPMAPTNAKCNLKPKTQNFPGVGGHRVPTHPRKILGFGLFGSLYIALLKRCYACRDVSPWLPQENTDAQYRFLLK